MKATQWAKRAFRCEECAEWHDLADAPVEEVGGWICSACEEFHEQEVPEPMTMIATEGREYVAPDDFNTCQMYQCPEDENEWGGDPIPISRWRVECGALLEEEPVPEPAYQCGECEEVYDDRDEAKECCR